MTFMRLDQKTGDVVVSFGGQPVSCARKLSEMLRPGTGDEKPRELCILRGGKPSLSRSTSVALTLLIPAGK